MTPYQLESKAYNLIRRALTLDGWRDLPEKLIAIRNQLDKRSKVETEWQRITS